MKRIDAIQAIHPRLEKCVLVTIMGAVAAEVQSIGHRPNFFYLQHAMSNHKAATKARNLAKAESIASAALQIGKYLLIQARLQDESYNGLLAEARPAAKTKRSWRSAARSSTSHARSKIRTPRCGHAGSSFSRV